MNASNVGAPLHAGVSPLPEPYLSAQVTASLLGPNVDEPLFTAEQMRAYAAREVAAERERIADAMRGIVRLLQLPDAPEYPEDERHTEKRMLLALADATVADSWPAGK